ncbi:hypothetical protein [Cardiobacterium hominis]|uniref:hypothetical protein n=1 Tax=Cardiobacterium hominis TaxID=2718 RepID=UPI0028EF1C97|nr:hypothetical protein [Cardiobacterium hominis]
MITPQDIFRFIFFAFWGGILFLLVIVWGVVYKCSEPGKAWRNNIIATVVVLGGVLAWIFIPSADERRLNREAEIRRQNRLKSRAVFEELCKTAGEKIYRTADNVEGVTLLKVWDGESIHKEDKLWKYAGLPGQYGQDGYIKGFLKWEVEIIPTGYPRYREMQFQPERQNHPYVLHGRYSYVDVKQKDGTFLRYRLDENRKEDYKMISAPIKIPSRYAVTFDNPIVPEEREHWIAHTRATVIDLQDNTVMASKDWYSFESQQGYGRYSMWVTAATCPELGVTTANPIRLFIGDVLKPKSGEQQ